MKWRKNLRALHRDIGYISVGLIIIYSVSGIAVNHVADWNPNYIIEHDTTKISVTEDSSMVTEKMVDLVMSDLKLSEKPVNLFRKGPKEVDLFYDGKTINADLEKGIAMIETITSRTVFRETNFLHLNAPKKLWTYVADAFAAALIFLAISGAIMMRGERGFAGRGKWFIAAGIAIPILFLILYF